MPISLLLKKYKSWLILVLGLGLLIVLIYILPTGRLAVSVAEEGSLYPHDDLALSVQKIGKQSPAPEQKINARDKKSFWLKPGLYMVKVTSTKEESISYVNVRRFFSAKSDLTLKPQAKASRLGGQSLGCNDVFNQVVVTYNCFGNSELNRLIPPTENTFSSTVPLANTSYVTKPTPYKNGYIMQTEEILDHPVLILVYYDVAKGTSQSIKLPQEMENQTLQVTTDLSSERVNSAFAVRNDKGKVALYKDVSDGNPTLINPTADSKIPTDFLAQNTELRGTTLSVSYYRNNEGPDSNDEAQGLENYKGGKILVYSAGNPKPTRTIPLPAKLDATKIQFVNDGILGVERDGGVELYKADKNKLKSRLARLDDAELSSVVGEKLIIIHSAAVYILEPDKIELHKIYAAQKLRIVNVNTSSSGRLLFTSFSSDEKSYEDKSSLFEIQTSTSASYPRMEDYLPLNSLEAPVRNMEYTDKLIITALGLESIESDHSTGQLGYDQAEFNQKRQEVLNKFKADNFDVSPYKLSFTP